MGIIIRNGNIYRGGGSNNINNLNGILSVENGGTGKTSITDARVALDVNKVTYSVTEPSLSTCNNGDIWIG